MGVQIFDNVFSRNLAKEFCSKAAMCRSHFYHRAHKDVPIFHWHRDKCDLAFAIHAQLPSSITNDHTLVRHYGNAHTAGINPSIHRDAPLSASGAAFTALYYYEMSWKDSWGGGTTFYDEEKNVTETVAYKGNRLVMFDGSQLHAADEISKDCAYLRPVAVLKYSADLRRYDGS